MKATTESNSKSETTVAARVASEDIRPGEYVAVLHEIIEYPSYPWSCSTETLPVDEPVRVVYKSPSDNLPLRVYAVCLPFIYVKRPRGEITTLDVRQHQLVRIKKRIGKRVWKRAVKAKRSK